MDIRADNGSSFHLKVLGYQFPEKEDEEWDSNWLMIYMVVAHPQGEWSVTDPFLLTYEVKELADWFDALSAHMQTENEIWFVEPNLRFEAIYLDDRESYLRVHFAIECLPPWARKGENGTEDVFADFYLADIDLQAAAESLREQLSLYPQRTTH